MNLMHMSAFMIILQLYDRGVCYSISHERISGELAICRNKNMKIARSFPYFIYSRIFQRTTTKLKITIITIIHDIWWDLIKEHFCL